MAKFDSRRLLPVEKATVEETVLTVRKELASREGHPPYLRHRLAITIARTALSSHGFTNHNNLVGIIAARTQTPHANPHPSSRRVTELYPLVATAVGQFIKGKQTADPWVALGRFARAINQETPDASDEERLKLFMEPLQLSGTPVEDTGKRTPSGEQILLFNKIGKQIVIPIYQTPSELTVADWTVTPYTRSYDWDIAALTKLQPPASPAT